MEYFIHSPRTRKTTRIVLEVDFDKLVDNYIKKDFKFVESTVQIAHVHPKDTYNHKTGREVCREMDESPLFLYKIEWITITDKKIVIKLNSGLMHPAPEHANLYLTKFKDSGKVIVTHKE